MLNGLNIDRHIIYVVLIVIRIIALIKENSFTFKKKKKKKKKKKGRSRQYSAETMTNTDYIDDQARLTNTPAKPKSLRHSLEYATGGIGLYVNVNKAEFICFKQEGAISTLSGKSLKLPVHIP